MAPGPSQDRPDAAIIAMAGLPGTGKSTLAQALARAVNGLILDKDHVRACLFPADLIAYSRTQDDLCVDIMLQVAGYLLNHTDRRLILLDGRTYSRGNQVEPVVTSAQHLGVPLLFIECQCREEVALRRIAGDQSRQGHPAENRDADLYRRIKAQREPLQAPHLTVDTEQPLEANLAACLRYLDERLTLPNATNRTPSQGDR